MFLRLESFKNFL